MSYTIDVIKDSNNNIIRPATITDNVINPKTQKSATEELDELKEISRYVESPEYKKIEVDADGNIISCIDKDDVRHEFLDVEFHSKFGVNEFKETTYVHLLVDSKNQILESIDENGDKVVYGGFEVLGSLGENLKSQLQRGVFGSTLEGKEMFTVGDSLSAGGNWQSKVVEVTGCSFSQIKNGKSGSQISIGGTTSYGSSRICGLARVVNLKKEGYNPDIIVFQNVNDIYAFDEEGNAMSGTISDKPYIINQFLQGYQRDAWNANAASLLNSIPQDERMFGTGIELLYNSSGKKLTITKLPTSEGDITLSVASTQTRNTYNIHVLPSDNMSIILNKILEYHFGNVTDVEGSDGVSVDFSSGGYVDVVFDGNNTGMTASISDTNSAKMSSVKFFDGDSLADWSDSSKWIDGINFYRAWKGIIEFCQINFPNAKLFMLLFPYHSTDPELYKMPNGTYDIDSYESSKKRINGVYREQSKIAEMFRIPIINANAECGISISNYSQYYYNGNVHPKKEGYDRAGEFIGKYLMTKI